MLSTLNALQQKAFLRLWNKIPAYIRAIHFDFENNLWTAADVDLGDLLCKYAHRFSEHSTDLGHVTVDPFRIIPKKDSQPVKQRTYRHSPVLAAKVQRLKISLGRSIALIIFKMVQSIGSNRQS